MNLHRPDLSTLRRKIRDNYLSDETAVIRQAVETASLSPEDCAAISGQAQQLVDQVRKSSHPHFTEQFLTDFGLSTDEGLALMCLAEALLRVPDAETVDLLIADKISTRDWDRLSGTSDSAVVNASTWALALTGKLLGPDSDGTTGTLKKLTQRIGEPAVRVAVLAAMRELGRQFVHGRDIDEALKRSQKRVREGYTYSYDMLGEAARTNRDALRYLDAYSHAIRTIAAAAEGMDVRRNPGISVKLSALHPRYETTQKSLMLSTLIERLRSLALIAHEAGIGLNIDAEEAERLDVSLDVIEALVSDPAFAAWEGIGIVVQAYGKRAALVLDWLYALANMHDRRIMVRLVKGAYWDTEIKRSQVLGIEDFPVFTRKVHSDISYIACARKLVGMTDRIYPQFATHNAHSATAILHLANEAGLNSDDYEFQRLHGMGEALHETVKKKNGTRCRIYAPVGAHRDLLAYLVRRLLENGANSSFVNQMADYDVPSSEIAADPFAAAAQKSYASNTKIPKPANIYPSGRTNSRGYDFLDPRTLDELLQQRGAFMDKTWQAGPMIDGKVKGADKRPVSMPHKPDHVIGEVTESAPADIETALESARRGYESWSAEDVTARADVLCKVADLYETHTPEFCALLALEAGKTLPDCIAEIREAVDFLRYYAMQAEAAPELKARGVFTCISPWNFPLAIFTGQISAALALGNAVLAKPAETTTLIAARAVELFHEAGLPAAALQLLPGQGSVVGTALTSDPGIDGVCFTGSTATAQRINRAMAAHMAPGAPLIAETGGLNAMIVDSTALPEQVVRDVIASSFQSAGQRCSALRLLYVQEDVYETVKTMLFGAMDELHVGDPAEFSTDIGPLINADAQDKIGAYVTAAENDGRLLKRCDVPSDGYFMAPSVIAVDGMADMTEEIFGPILHIATFEGEDINKVIDAVNGSGYGLTFGLQTRIDRRVSDVTRRIHAGNVYINRNQIGAIVESQPFGGEGLSGTGPKAGGPNYLKRFAATEETEAAMPSGAEISAAALASALGGLAAPNRTSIEQALVLPGPTGEENRLITHPRGVVLCLGPGNDAAARQAEAALAFGCSVLIATPDATSLESGFAGYGARVKCLDGVVAASSLADMDGIDAVALWAEADVARGYRKVLAARDGVLIPLVTSPGPSCAYFQEQSICIDTTAAGGNAALLGEVSG